MNKLVLASSNPGKLREFEQMLAPLNFEIIPQSRLGIADADEPHATFVENALAKARHASRIAGLPAFADDSGICVDALEGRPGVHSARYAHEANSGAALSRDQQDELNNRKLIEQLTDQSNRGAHYYCIIVLMRHPEDPEPLIAEGRWHGEIIDRPRGKNGFGYDPFFHVAALGRTAAELEPFEKNAISHRGLALKQLIAALGDRRS